MTRTMRDVFGGRERTMGALFAEATVSKRVGPDQYEFQGKKGRWRTVKGNELFFPDDGSAPMGMPPEMRGDDGKGGGKKTVKWKKPNLADETGEYLENEFTKRYFKKKGIVMKSAEEVERFLSKGKMQTVSRDDLKNADNITNNDKDFEQELKDPEYAKSFRRMQRALDKGGLELPTPILVRFGDKLYGFAGNRRTNLAFRNKVPLKAWVVDAGAKD